MRVRFSIWLRDMRILRGVAVLLISLVPLAPLQAEPYELPTVDLSLRYDKKPGAEDGPIGENDGGAGGGQTNGDGTPVDLQGSSITGTMDKVAEFQGEGSDPDNWDDWTEEEQAEAEPEPETVGIATSRFNITPYLFVLGDGSEYGVQLRVKDGKPHYGGDFDDKEMAAIDAEALKLRNNLRGWRFKLRAEQAKVIEQGGTVKLKVDKPFATLSKFRVSGPLVLAVFKPDVPQITSVRFVDVKSGKPVVTITRGLEFRVDVEFEAKPDNPPQSAVLSVKGVDRPIPLRATRAPTIFSSSSYWLFGGGEPDLRKQRLTGVNEDTPALVGELFGGDWNVKHVGDQLGTGNGIAKVAYDGSSVTLFLTSSKGEKLFDSFEILATRSGNGARLTLDVMLREKAAREGTGLPPQVTGAEESLIGVPLFATEVAADAYGKEATAGIDLGDPLTILRVQLGNRSGGRNELSGSVDAEIANERLTAEGQQTWTRR